MYIDVTAELPEDGTLFHRNPDAPPDTSTETVRSAMMGDIVQTEASSAEISIDVRAHAGIARVELRNAGDVVEVLRPYSEDDLGNRIRVLWSGAEYRGRNRAVNWSGRAKFEGLAINRIGKINQWNPDQFFEQRGSNMMVWNSVTTGNFMGFDAWLSGDDGALEVSTNHGNLAVNLQDVGIEPTRLGCGGLEKEISVQRLPETTLAKQITAKCKVDLAQGRDNPIWICVTTEDGFQAWTSPIYLFGSNGAET